MTYAPDGREQSRMFVETNISLIEQGIDEIQAAKDRFTGRKLDLDPAPTIQRLVVADGTHDSEYRGPGDAELEYGSC